MDASHAWRINKQSESESVSYQQIIMCYHENKISSNIK